MEANALEQPSQWDASGFFEYESNPHHNDFIGVDLEDQGLNEHAPPHLLTTNDYSGNDQGAGIAGQDGMATAGLTEVQDFQTPTYLSGNQTMVVQEKQMQQDGPYGGQARYDTEAQGAAHRTTPGMASWQSDGLKTPAQLDSLLGGLGASRMQMHQASPGYSQLDGMDWGGRMAEARKNSNKIAQVVPQRGMTKDGQLQLTTNGIQPVERHGMLSPPDTADSPNKVDQAWTQMQAGEGALMCSHFWDGQQEQQQQHVPMNDSHGWRQQAAATAFPQRPSSIGQMPGPHSARPHPSAGHQRGSTDIQAGRREQAYGSMSSVGSSQISPMTASPMASDMVEEWGQQAALGSEFDFDQVDRRYGDGRGRKQSSATVEMNEDDRREHFLARNREAANKCRSKAKEKNEENEHKARFLGHHNTELKLQKEKLQAELFRLRDVIIEHCALEGCQCNKMREWIRLKAFSTEYRNLEDDGLLRGRRHQARSTAQKKAGAEEDVDVDVDVDADGDTDDNAEYGNDDSGDADFDDV